MIKIDPTELYPSGFVKRILKMNDYDYVRALKDGDLRISERKYKSCKENFFSGVDIIYCFIKKKYSTQNKKNMTFAKQLEEAFNKIGGSMMSDDFASKLLAWAYVMGGNTEIITKHTGLNSGISIAQQKFNINGGEVPCEKGIKLVKQRITELEKHTNDTDWLREIEERYEIKLPKY